MQHGYIMCLRPFLAFLEGVGGSAALAVAGTSPRPQYA